MHNRAKLEGKRTGLLDTSLHCIVKLRAPPKVSAKNRATCHISPKLRTNDEQENKLAAKA